MHTIFEGSTNGFKGPLQPFLNLSDGQTNYETTGLRGDKPQERSYVYERS
jgi:hypothetical protein